MDQETLLACPDCGHPNLPGNDTCEQCGQSLTSLSKPRPRLAVAKAILTERLETLSPREPVCVPPTATVAEALELLVSHSIGCVLIVDQDKVVGVFSERDALIRIGADVQSLESRPVLEFATPNPDALESTDKIVFALHRMDLGGYRHVPILSQGKVTGIISIRDILRYITEKLGGVSF